MFHTLQQEQKARFSVDENIDGNPPETYITQNLIKTLQDFLKINMMTTRIHIITGTAPASILTPPSGNKPAEKGLNHHPDVNQSLSPLSVSDKLDDGLLHYCGKWSL